MSEQVSAFWPVQIGVFEYLFFVANWNDYSSTISSSLDSNLEKFGIGLGLKGKVIESYSHAKGDTFKEITQKDHWPYNVKERFEKEQFPFMLVIDESFEKFDPGKHRWGIIWFSDFVNDPNSVPKIFGSLVRKIRQDIDLFEYLISLARDHKTKEFTEYFEIKPGIFGISVDIKALLFDIGGYLRDRIGG